ncbi:hypothetical protein BDV40DRAFT_115866 [Aspergillus tamarii]|uniref:BZIP domain-containing protein n=1 Tax=Aspergillus tamarii TaxID=41984 RepID=A0A5N6UZZ4_ASPTM|nr:hypothetical protein BDV40DRAFT_115866 [Aspergillus tamarii]
MQNSNSMKGRPTSLRDAATAELKAQLDKDDWRGIVNPTERRRRQNRVHQRAYRNRKREQVQRTEGTPQCPKANRDDLQLRTERQMLEDFLSRAHRSYLLGRPSADHLLTLTKANVYRAFLQNINLLGLVADGLCEVDVLSPFCQFGPTWPVARTLPPSLRPTFNQCLLPHHPWLDFFPHPRARDTLIRRLGDYDEDDFCLDILGFWNPDAPDNMLLVWGEPSAAENWEVTEGFIKKWGWVIQGCPDILHNTNKWRARRGENPILRYL